MDASGEGPEPTHPHRLSIVLPRRVGTPCPRGLTVLFPHHFPRRVDSRVHAVAPLERGSPPQGGRGRRGWRVYAASPYDYQHRSSQRQHTHTAEPVSDL